LTRDDLQDHLLDLWSFDQTTMIRVTHDIEEAVKRHLRADHNRWLAPVRLVS
jgi:ABC-type nitrate/sulfonate/bicarbonate transport system ATPase subunit